MARSFTNWDGRPAVLDKSPAGTFALAKLSPDAGWTEVDASDVWATAGVMSEGDFVERFGKRFGFDAASIPEVQGSKASAAE